MACFEEFWENVSSPLPPNFPPHLREPGCSRYLNVLHMNFNRVGSANDLNNSSFGNNDDVLYI